VAQGERSERPSVTGLPPGEGQRLVALHPGEQGGVFGKTKVQGGNVVLQPEGQQVSAQKQAVPQAAKGFQVDQHTTALK